MFNKPEFDAALARACCSRKQLAKALGIDVATLYRKVKDDGSFTRKEINIIIKELNIKNPEAIFFAEELT